MNNKRSTPIKVTASLIVGGICLLGLAACTSHKTTTDTTPSTTEQTTANMSEVSLTGLPFNYGAIDMIRLAVQLGGNTTYDVASSDLIGAKVVHTYRNNKLDYETTELDSRDITAYVDGTTATLSMRVGKGLDDTLGEYRTLNNSLRAKVLAECLQLPSDKESYLVSSGLADNYFSQSNEGAMISIDPAQKAISTYSITGDLATNTDFITSSEFQNSLDSYSKALQTKEAVLTTDPTAWSDGLLAKLEGYQLSSISYIVRYAPNDPENKSTDMNEWYVNNYDVNYKFENPETKQVWHFAIMSLAPNNLYGDTREFATGIYIADKGIIRADELHRIVKAVYGENPESTSDKESYQYAENGLGFWHTQYR